MKSAITVSNLHYAYVKDKPILKGLSLDVPSGSIYGFLGENGAGKSTTIRCILGLLRPGTGEVQVLEQPLQTQRLSIMASVGALIESPAIYGHLTGRDNLRVMATYLALPLKRMDEVLDIVGLTHHAGKLSKQYSTGMKQRLGLALALLKDPDLLILDEPTNGLDPSGIIDMRETLKRLNDQGKTIFLSSHLLSEIEKIATRVGIINGGKTLFEGSISDLEQLKSHHHVVDLVVDDTAKAEPLLSGIDFNSQNPNRLSLFLDGRDQVPEIVQKLVDASINIYELTPRKSDLESLFLQLTDDDNGGVS